MADSLWPCGLQHRFSCPSQPPRACSNSYPLNRWCHPTISSSVVLFSCLLSFPASESFQMSQLFASGGQYIGTSASASVLPINMQGWSPLGWTGWIFHFKGLSRVFSKTLVQKHQFSLFVKLSLKKCLLKSLAHFKIGYWFFSFLSFIGVYIILMTWEGLGAGGEWDDRGLDGLMASPTLWTWVWVNSGSWWWTGRPGVLRFMESQKSWTRLSDWTDWIYCWIYGLQRFSPIPYVTI